MSDLMKFIQEADIAALEMETARTAVENSKLALEKAKENFEGARKFFDEVLLKADELGIPRPKVRKLIEERTLGLVSSGLIEADAKPAVAKAPKAPRKTGKAKQTDLDEALEQEPASLEMN